jgi:transaldolase
LSESFFFSQQQREEILNAAHQLHPIDQSFWLEGFTRDMVDSLKYRQLIEETSAAGLIFNTTALEWAIKNSETYDISIRQKLREDVMGEYLLLELIMEDASRAADLFRPIYDQTGGAEGWVSLDVSPRTLEDPIRLINTAKEMYARIRRPNIMINIPGTKKGLIAVVEAISGGVPVNITHLFSTGQLSLALAAYAKGVEQRIVAGFSPDIRSVATLNISRWDAENIKKLSDGFSKPLGLAIARYTYDLWREHLHSPRWERACIAGARPLRLLWKGIEPDTSETMKVLGVDTLPALFKTVTIFEALENQSAGDGKIPKLMTAGGRDCGTVISRFVETGIDIDTLADAFQKDALSSFVKGWLELMTAVASKSAALI